MKDSHEHSPKDAQPSGAAQYELWYDGLLDESAARREHARVMADPLLRARFEADRAIESSLRRSFGAPASARPMPVGRALPAAPARPTLAWSRYAIAAGMLAVIGAAFAISFVRGHSKPNPSPDVVKTPSKGRVNALGQLAASSAPAQAPSVQYSLGDVFLDALALDFQPLLGCRAKDRWDAELFAQLADAPCNREDGVVVLGEWIDPRLDVANVLMLRRGENPIMLVVPRCEEETELCVPKDSGLYVHRGMRDGRPIYEISPISGSEVLGCVEAKNVVTQQQF